MSFFKKVFGGKSKSKSKSKKGDTFVDNPAPTTMKDLSDDDEEYVMIDQAPPEALDEYQALDEVDIKEAQHMEWLSRQEIRTGSIIIECGQQGIYAEIKFADVPRTASVLHDLLKNKPGQKHIFLPNVDRSDLLYYVDLNRRSPSVEALSDSYWEILIHLVATCEEVGDASWHDDLVASMRLKAKKWKFAAKSMPGEKELIWAYQKTKAGSILRSVFVEITMGTKAYLAELQNPPAEFLKEIAAELQNTKEEGGRAGALELRARAAALEAARATRSSPDRKPVPRIKRKEPDQRPIFKAELEAQARVARSNALKNLAMARSSALDLKDPSGAGAVSKENREAEAKPQWQSKLPQATAPMRLDSSSSNDVFSIPSPSPRQCSSSKPGPSNIPRRSMSGAYNGPSSGLKTSFPSTVPRLKPFTSSLRDVSRSQASAPINVPRRQPSTASLSSAPRRDFTSKYSNSVLRHRASMNYASGSLRAQAMLLKVDTHHGPRLGGIPSDDDEAFAHYKSEMKEKPVRQPRNPPLLDELEAAPTLKHKGSRNFMRWGGK